MQGEREEIRLRKMTLEDLPVFRRWLDASHVAKWYQDPEDWVVEVEQQAGAFCWIHHFIAELDGAPVGFCQYYAARDSDESWLAGLEREGTYSIDYLIGEERCLRKGLGRQLLARLEEAILQNGDARRIVVQPDSNNTPSCKLLLSCGYALADPGNGVYAKELRRGENRS